MMTMAFLAEWAFRSSILILSGGLLLWALRVKDPAIRLAAWTAMLAGSLAIPLLSAVLPKTPVAVWSAPAQTLRTNRMASDDAPAPVAVVRQAAAASSDFDWRQWGVLAYLTVAGGLLLRLGARVAMSRRLLRGSRATGRTVDGTEIRESDQISAPVTLGIVRSTIVVPGDWREWDDDKWNAVVAHERSHIARRDPAVQMLSAIHCALVWHSPLSWFLNRQIVRVAEEASDDAAVEATQDRATYAELLLEFMQRGVRSGNWQGVAMARYGRPDERIHRILDGTALSRGVTRWSAAAILALGSPLAYVAASAHPQAQVAPSAPRAAVAAQAPATPQTPATAHAAATASQSGTIRRYMIFMGDSTSGSWDSNDPVDEKGLRSKFGRHFAWFRQAGNEYVVTDSGVLAELEQAMEPQKEVNRMQDAVNVHQDKVNAMQGGVNAQQDGVNGMQQQVNKAQDLINRIQSAAGKSDQNALIRELERALEELRASKNSATQESVNQRQSQVNQAQSRVNAEQDVVNTEQHKVNEAQHRVSAEYGRRIQDILDSAVRRRLAQQLM